VTREELFVTTKLTQAHHRPGLVEPCLRRSLENLQLDYVDLYLVHAPICYHYDERLGLWPNRSDGSRMYDLETTALDTWKGMEGVHAAGLARSIGVSNFSSSQLIELAAQARVVPAVNQCESHPLLVQPELLAVCRHLGVVFEAYSPLGGSDQGSEMKAQLLSNSDFLAIAERHGKTVPQVLLKWQVQRGVVTVAKSFTPSRIEQNAALFDWSLSDDEMATLSAHDACWRGVPPGTVGSDSLPSGAPSGQPADGHRYAKYADHPLYPWPELLGVPLDKAPPQSVRDAALDGVPAALRQAAKL
jgi:diketogulonate reductase-like aldo/keto reductase